MQYRPSRRATHVAATLVVDDLILETTVLDVSRDGAKLALSGGLAPGTAVYLKVEGVTMPALVHWSDGDRAGVRFFDRLDLATLLILESAADGLAAFR